MKLVIFTLILLTVGCAKRSQEDQAVCSKFVSPYMVEYTDGSILKSDVEDCGSAYTATSLDQSGKTMTAETLTIQLKNATTGIPYLTNFTGQ